MSKPAGPNANTQSARETLVNNPTDYTAKLFPDLSYTQIDVEIIVTPWDQGDIGDYIEFGPTKEILFLNSDADFVTSKLIVGDRLLKLDDKPVAGLIAEDLVRTLHQEGKHKLSVTRRVGLTPVPRARMNSLGLMNTYGFTYAVLGVTRASGDDMTKLKTFGYQGRVVNNKVFVCKVFPGTPAARWLAVGDALLDLNNSPVPFNQTTFVNQYWHNYKTKGGFTAVVERPCTQEALDTINGLIASFFPPPQQQQIHMGADAVSIGANASKMHRMFYRKIQPIPLLKTAPAGSSIMGAPPQQLQAPAVTASLSVMSKPLAEPTTCYSVLGKLPVDPAALKMTSVMGQIPMDAPVSNSVMGKPGESMMGKPSESVMGVPCESNNNKKQTLSTYSILPKAVSVMAAPQLRRARSLGRTSSTNVARTKSTSQTNIGGRPTVRIWNKVTETSIGTDVPEEKRLKRVPSKAKKGFFSFLDLF